MAISQCRECGDKVSTEAKTCPHCGVPHPTTEGCTQCNGSGYIECPACEETGERVCPICRGTGTDSEGYNCKQCEGNQKIPCSKCGGAAVLDCPICGKGRAV